MVIYTGKTASGATYSIHDDYMAPKGSEQERRIAEEQRRAAYEILIAAQTRKSAS